MFHNHSSLLLYLLQNVSVLFAPFVLSLSLFLFFPYPSLLSLFLSLPLSIPLSLSLYPSKSLSLSLCLSLSDPHALVSTLTLGVRSLFLSPLSLVWQTPKLSNRQPHSMVVVSWRESCQLTPPLGSGPTKATSHFFFWGGGCCKCTSGGGVMQDSAWELHGVCPVQHWPPPTFPCSRAPPRPTSNMFCNFS